MGTPNPETAEPPTESPPIPPESRPSPASADSSGDNADAPEPEYHPSGRKVRSDKGTGKSGAAARTPHRKGASADRKAKAEAGASILYGGVGMLLAAGIAPAAGFTMQGLADEAGGDIAEWARQRSPRFYDFLCSVTDAAGVGKYLAAPASAEAYARAPQLRPALGPVLVAAIGQDGAEQVHGVALQYDEARVAPEPSESDNGASQAHPVD